MKGTIYICLSFIQYESTKTNQDQTEPTKNWARINQNCTRINQEKQSIVPNHASLRYFMDLFTPAT